MVSHRSSGSPQAHAVQGSAPLAPLPSPQPSPPRHSRWTSQHCTRTTLWCTAGRMPRLARRNPGPRCGASCGVRAAQRCASWAADDPVQSFRLPPPAYCTSQALHTPPPVRHSSHPALWHCHGRFRPLRLLSSPRRNGPARTERASTAALVAAGAPARRYGRQDRRGPRRAGNGQTCPAVENVPPRASLYLPWGR